RLTNAHRDAAVTSVEFGLHTNRAADLDASIRAWDIEETSAIQTANLHVLDRLGLDGKIGCLCSRYCDETRRGAEEKAFHHLHIPPPVCDSSEGSSPTGKVPSSPDYPARELAAKLPTRKKRAKH